jgi:hypothetical protein
VTIKAENGHDEGMTRRRAYFALMGVCVGLITLAWLVVRLASITAAVVMSVIAMLIPPIAVVIANPVNPKARPDPGDDL